MFTHGSSDDSYLQTIISAFQQSFMDIKIKLIKIFSAYSSGKIGVTRLLHC